MKNSWKYAAVGFVVGLIVMFCIGNFIDKKQTDEEISEIYQHDEAGQTSTERPTPTEEPITIEDKETEEQQLMAEPESTFKSDSGKEIEEKGEEISKGIRISNNIFNFKLENENRTLYMSIDTFNMKIFVYDEVVE